MKPVIVEEIEFYVSNDGLKTGLSQNGLAILCGVKESTIRELLNKSMLGQNQIDILKPLLNKDLWFEVEAENNAKVVKSEYAAKVIEYYAFESKATNNTAKYSFRKFATIGIEKWIKDIAGYRETKLSSTDELLGQLLLKFEGLEKETKELRTLRGKTKTVYLGLDKLLDDLVKEEDDLLPPEDKNSLDRKYTLTEWLREEKGIYDISPSLKSKLAIMVSQNFKALKYKDPEKGIRKHKNGKINNGVSLYSITDFPILDMSLTKILLKHQ